MNSDDEDEDKDNVCTHQRSYDDCGFASGQGRTHQKHYGKYGTVVSLRDMCLRKLTSDRYDESLLPADVRNDWVLLQHPLRWDLISKHGLRDRTGDQHQRDGLYYACQHGDMELLEWIEGNNSVWKSGWEHAFVIAARHNQVHICKYLANRMSRMIWQVMIVGLENRKNGEVVRALWPALVDECRHVNKEKIHKQLTELLHVAETVRYPGIIKNLRRLRRKYG